MRPMALLLLTALTGACSQRGDDAPGAPALYPAGFYWEEEFVRYQAQEAGDISSEGEFSSDELDPNGSEEKGRQVTKILSPTHLETFGKTGYLAQTILQIDESSVKDYSGVRTELPRGRPWIGERLFVEEDGWLLELPVYGSRSFSATGSNVSSNYNVIAPFGDMEVTKGKSVFPLHPVIGGVYTGDTAIVYEAVGVETAFEQPAVKLSRQFAPQIQKLATFFEDCFTEEIRFGKKQLRINSSCKEFINGYPGPRFTPVQESSLWIGGNVRLKSVTNTETTTVYAVCCNDSCDSLGWNYQSTINFYACYESDEIYFRGSRSVQSEAYEVTRTGTDADTKTQPTLEDNGVTP